MFVYRNKPDKHPITLAAMMTSVTKEREDYEYLASSLYRKGIRSLTYGTDGEFALEQRFENVFPITSSSDLATEATNNIHLRCFTHVEADIKAKLQQLKVDSKEQRTICSQILGGEKDGRRIKGLVDCQDDESFDAALALSRLRWSAEFTKWMFSAKGLIRPLTETLKMCVMKPLRVAAGLGNPPNKWHNQGTEALHHVMREEAHGQSIDQATIHENVNHRVVQQQNSEFIKAVYGMGEYRLAPGYENLSIDSLRWSQMTPEQRSAYIKKVLGQGLLDDKDPDDIALKKLSISLEESGLPKQLASQVVADIWRKAEIILARFKVIPLDNGNFCVTESDKAFTVENKKGNFKCKDCACSAATGGICQHSIAVKQHIQTYAQQNHLESRIAFKNIPRGVGAKCRQKKPRRGNNNVEQEPLLEELDPNSVHDPDLDFAKPCRFTEFYHNDVPFNIVFVNDFPNAKSCEQCKVNFSRTLPIAPWDTCVMHKERYLYPVKDPQNATKVLRCTPTREKTAARFYCPKKEWLLPRHPYFWTGRLKMKTDMKDRLRDSHKMELLKGLRYKV